MAKIIYVTLIMLFALAIAGIAVLHSISVSLADGLRILVNQLSDGGGGTGNTTSPTTTTLGAAFESARALLSLIG